MASRIAEIDEIARPAGSRSTRRVGGGHLDCDPVLLACQYYVCSLGRHRGSHVVRHGGILVEEKSMAVIQSTGADETTINLFANPELLAGPRARPASPTNQFQPPVIRSRFKTADCTISNSN